MMKVIFALLLLYSTSLHAEEPDAPEKNIEPNIWNEVRDVRDMIVEQKVIINMLRNENIGLSKRLKYTEAMVEEFKKEKTESPKVAFSADLGHLGHLGPFDTDITLTFNNVFTNIGNNYNPITGLFTATVKGVYYFRFTVCSPQKLTSLGGFLYRNGEKIVSIGQWRSHNDHRYGSNAAVLQLEVGDVVSMKLNIGYAVYDSKDNLSTFSGFLIYPL